MLQAYRDAAALNTAIELELFTRIAHGTDTASKIAAELDLPIRGIRALCNYLAVTGLIVKDGEDLQLTDESSTFLVNSSPACLTNAAPALYATPLLRGYERLTDLVCGRATAESVNIPGWFSLARGVTDRTAATRAFADAMLLPAGPSKILDVGAGEGEFGIGVASRYPEAVMVAADRPAALKLAQRNADEARLGTRYQNIPGDLLSMSFGQEYDAAIVAHRLYQLDPPAVDLLMKRIRDALKKTGQLYILEFLSEELPEYAGATLSMLAATRRGGPYTIAEVKQKLVSSGYGHIESRPLPEAHATLVTARF